MERHNYRRRLVSLLLAGAFVLVCAFSADAQNLSLKFNNSPLKEVLAGITRESGYNFVYSEKNINPLTAVSITYNGPAEPIGKVLDKLFNGTGIAYQINGKQIALSIPQGGTTPKKGNTVSGRILDENQQPLVGVAVLNERTQKYATSDLDGVYAIEANEGEKLSFTLIGMQPYSATVGKNAVVNIPMKTDLITLESVVVTGYQDIQKEKVTGSITTVSSKKIEERYTPNILNNLEGRVAGLVTYGGKTTIRGSSSLYAETNPLLVVDGLPIEGKIEDLNPYDIESINVLKDASATAIYGARASNGIIVVTTKNAKKQGKIDIDFSANLSLYERKNMDYVDNFYMNAAQQVKTESDYYEYYFFNNEGEVVDPIASVGNEIANGISPISPIQYNYYKLAKGEIGRDQLNVVLDGLRKNNFAKEYGNLIYKRQFLQQYNLALRSRSEKFQSNLTLNYKTDNSGVINSGVNQMNINYKGTYEVAKWLTASVSINSIYGKTKTQGSDYNSSHANPWAIPAYESMYNADGSDRKFYYWYSGNEWWPGNTEEGLHDMGVKIRDEFSNNVKETKRQHMRYHGDLQFKIIKGLTANAQFIYEDDRVTTDWHANEQSHLARTLRNAYTTKDASGKVTYLTPRSGGMLQTTNTLGAYWTARGQVNYVNTFGKHSIAALAGVEFRESKCKGTKSLALGYDEQLQNSGTHTVDFGALSLMNYSPWFMASAGGFYAKQFVFDPYLREGMGVVVEEMHRYASGYANLTYTYDNRYNAFASFRKDYADVYGLNAKFRGKPLWSVGVNWNIHNEKFMENINWMDVLKLRISYGVTGNIYQGATSYMTATSTGLNEYTNLPYGEVESPANPNLKWEQSRTTNLGLDFSFWGNRLRGSLDYYNKEGKDIFSDKILDPSTGFSSMFVNMASIRNSGVELQLTYDWFREKRAGGFSWSTSYTFSYNKNRVTSVENPSSQAYQLIKNPFQVGYPTSAMWSYRFAGISDATGEKGQTLWYTDNNNVSHNAVTGSINILEYSGQKDPVTVMGMDNRLTFKGFSLSILMAYYGGHKMRALTERETDGIPYSAIESYFLNAWTPENPTNTPGIGRYASSSLGSEPTNSNISVHDADFIKIRNIVVGYELPERWLKGLKMNRISLRFQIDNPKALWVKNNVGVDPETLGLRNPSAYILGVNINL